MDPEVLEQPLNPESLKQILAFFNKNGLTEAEETLKREASAVLRLSKEPLDATDVNNDAILREYGALLSHVDASFDNFRAEFASLLFPVFAHLYIQLIFEGHSSLARVFGEKYARSVPSMYEEPTYSLLRISTHGQAVSHPLVHALTKNNFVLRMSKAAIKQLEPFLARNATIKEIIHDHIVIEPVDGTRTKAAVEASLGGIIGQISKQDRKHKMFYGTVKEDLSSQLGVEKKRLKGKDRNDSKKKDANGPAPDRIPLPALIDRRSMVKESTKKVRISAESPPSVCLYTALNASGGLTAADFSDDSACLAVGYGNSIVQVHCLNEEKLCPLKKIEQLETLDLEADDIFEQVYDESQAATQLTFQGHTKSVCSVSFSPDKRLLLSSSSDATVRLWNIATRSNVVVYRQILPVWQAQFCSRSYYFATGSADGTATLWATDRLQPLRIFADALSDVSCIDFHPNCNYIIGGSDDRYVRVWDVLSGACVRTFSSHKGPIRAVKVSPCGRYLASVGAEGSLMIWDMGMQRAVCLQEVTPTPFMSALAFSREGSALALGRSDCGLSFYSLDSVTAHATSQEHLSNDPKINPSGFHMFTYSTKQTPIVGLHFTRRNLVLGVGAFGQ
uniref:Transcription initiation factor TFIID subunit 5 n=2 Tax=Ascaris suum TaxID=6253 RepID=F1KW86_ASCSU